MMKYIITWVLYLTHSIPCPSAINGYDCGLAHLMTVSVYKDSAFTNRKQAFIFYDAQNKVHEDALIKTYSLSTGETYMSFIAGFGAIGDIRIDSICINPVALNK